MELRFHHVGIATPDVSAAISTYLNLGYQLDFRVTDETQGVELAFLHRLNHPLLELVGPAKASSPVDGILRKVGATPYHICFEVDDIDAAVEHCRSLRFRPVSDPVPAVAFKNRLIVFVHNPLAGLVELLQSETNAVRHTATGSQ